MLTVCTDIQTKPIAEYTTADVTMVLTIRNVCVYYVWGVPDVTVL